MRANYARALVAVGQARSSNCWLRLGASAIAALVSTSIVGNITPLYWLVGLIAVVLTDRVIYRKVMLKAAAGAPPEKLGGLTAWTLFQSAYGNLLAVILWFAPYVPGETLAVIYIIAGLANAAATLRPSPPLALAAAAPTVMIFIALPIASYLAGGSRNPLELMPLLGALLFLGFGVNLWRSLVASDIAQAEAEAAAQRERQAAAAAAAAKSDTIRRMNDELRTPMTALVGAAEHLRRAAVSSEARAHIATLVQAGELLRLVLDDLTHLDSLENGQVRIDPRPTDPRELVRGVVSAFRAAAQDKQLELFLDVGHDVPELVDIDAPRVRQILFNLLANAVRFTQHGGVRVRLQAQRAQTPGRTRLGFVVADTGIGMSRSQLALIFGRGRLSDVGGGPGLGLSISLRLARLMGAQLGGKSELGQGSVFSFVLEAPVIGARDMTAA
ncbi:sensor histidine kinase [Terricaulis sp.]|uniref:sensor histidine kinase n=1 Tax=Terricaulis sp. TaxID=2768686 RepID=UPI003783405E